MLHRRPLGNCGVPDLGPYPVTDLSLTVDRVRYGVVEESTIVITALGHLDFPSGSPRAGSRVIAWASRECHDAWRLWGHFCMVSHEGNLVPPIGFEDLYHLTPNRSSLPLRYTALDSALSQSSVVHSVALFDGVAAVSLVRLVGSAASAGGGYIYECDSIGWVLG